MAQAPQVDRVEVEDRVDEDHARRGDGASGRDDIPLPGARIGIVAGVVGILCCVGPAALALLGLISGAAAFTLATDLYRDWAWGFRLLGLAVAAGLVWLALRRRNACTVEGVRRSWRSLLVIAVVGAVTYGVFYAVTTWLGMLAV